MEHPQNGPDPPPPPRPKLLPAPRNHPWGSSGWVLGAGSNFTWPPTRPEPYTQKMGRTSTFYFMCLHYESSYSRRCHQGHFFLISGFRKGRGHKKMFPAPGTHTGDPQGWFRAAGSSFGGRGGGGSGPFWGCSTAYYIGLYRPLYGYY